MQSARHSACFRLTLTWLMVWPLYADGLSWHKQLSWLPSAAACFTVPAVLGHHQAAQCLTWLADLPTDPSALMTSTQVTKASLSVA